MAFCFEYKNILAIIAFKMKIFIMKYTISKENYELLQKIVELAESRLPLQGKFDIDSINGYLAEKERQKKVSNM